MSNLTKKEIIANKKRIKKANGFAFGENGDKFYELVSKQETITLISQRVLIKSFENAN